MLHFFDSCVYTLVHPQLKQASRPVTELVKAKSATCLPFPGWPGWPV